MVWGGAFDLDLRALSVEDDGEAEVFCIVDGAEGVDELGAGLVEAELGEGAFKFWPGVDDVVAVDEEMFF